jgi:ribosomal protein S7
MINTVHPDWHRDEENTTQIRNKAMNDGIKYKAGNLSYVACRSIAIRIKKNPHAESELRRS